MLMAWLLKYDGYPPGVLVALLLHGLLLYILMPSEADPEQFVRIERPAITAVVTQANPQQVRRMEQINQQRRADDAARQRQEAERQRQAEAQRVEQQRQADTARRQEEQRVAEANRQAEAKRQEDQRLAEARRQEEARQAEARRQEEARQQAQRQQQEEAQRQAAAAAAAEAANAQNDLVAQYSAIIHDLISNQWSRPPDARNGMSVVLNLRLVPTGEVVSATIIKSSGNAAFDRSAEQAVARVGGFPELRDVPTPVFERNFRDFNLEFRPEDLLR